MDSKRFLFGDDWKLSAKFFVGVVVCTALVPVVYGFYPDRTVWGVVSFPTALLIVMVVPAIVHAYLNDGLLPTLLLGVIAGFQHNLYNFLFAVDVPYRSNPNTVVDVLAHLQLPVIGVQSAAIGFLIAIFLRYGVKTVQSQTQTNPS